MDRNLEQRRPVNLQAAGSGLRQLCASTTPSRRRAVVCILHAAVMLSVIVPHHLGGVRQARATAGADARIPVSP